MKFAIDQKKENLKTLKSNRFLFKPLKHKNREWG